MSHICIRRRKEHPFQGIQNSAAAKLVSAIASITPGREARQVAPTVARK